MSNIDLFEKPEYTVHVNGLFGLTSKASVTEKIILGGGIFEQVRDSTTHHYNRMSDESFREMLTLLAMDEHRTIGHAARGREANMTILDEAGPFPGNYIAGIDPYTIAPEDSDSFVTTTITTQEQLPREYQEQLLQTQLRNGEITMFEYLDQISEL